MEQNASANLVSAGMENFVLRPLSSMYRAPLESFRVEGSSARSGTEPSVRPGCLLAGPLDLISFEDDVAIQPEPTFKQQVGSGQQLRVGPVHLQSGCKIGMRAAVANNVTVGQGSWITPFTPILTTWARRRFGKELPRDYRPLHRVEAHGKHVPVRVSDLVTRDCQHPDAAIRLLLAQRGPHRSYRVVRQQLHPYRGIDGLHGFQRDVVVQILWPLTLDAFITTWVTLVVTSLLACLFIRFTASSPGLCPARPGGALLMYRVNRMNAIQRQWTWTITGST